MLLVAWLVTLVDFWFPFPLPWAASGKLAKRSELCDLSDGDWGWESESVHACAGSGSRYGQHHIVTKRTFLNSPWGMSTTEPSTKAIMPRTMHNKRIVNFMLTGN